MKRIALLALLTSLSAPLFAQSSTVTIFATRQQNGGSARVPSEGRDIRAEFDDPNGFGVAVSHAFGARYSGELALFRVSPTASLHENSGASAELGELSLAELTAMGRVHLRRGGPFDVYAGAGVASVMAGTIVSHEFGNVRVDNEYTFAVGGGATWDFNRRVGVAFDARYLPLTLHARPAGENMQIGFDLDPLLVSAGLRIRF